MEAVGALGGMEVWAVCCGSPDEGVARVTAPQAVAMEAVETTLDTNAPAAQTHIRRT